MPTVPQSAEPNNSATTAVADESSPIVVEPLSSLFTASEMEEIDEAMEHESDSSDDEEVEKRRYTNDLIMFRKASQTYVLPFEF